MPWLPEFHKEQIDEAKELGREIKQTEKRNATNQSRLNFLRIQEKKTVKAKKDVEMRVERPLRSKNELYSYMVKVPRVELFDWKIRVDTLDKNKVKRTIEKPIKDI